MDLNHDFPLKRGTLNHSSSVSYNGEAPRKKLRPINWVDQIRTDISHHQKMVFFLIKLQLKIKFIYLASSPREPRYIKM